MTIYLSPHFTLEEMTRSQIAARLGVDNQPGPAELAALKRTCMGLEAVRVRLGGAPILITSGFRCLPVNRALGSKDTSQHPKGEAVDFVAPRFGTPRQVVDAVADSDVPYDQLIWEFARWVHISFSDNPRRQVLAIDNSGTRPLYT